MKIFITGGCKNGKSTFALKQVLHLSEDCPRYYIATMEPKDEEEMHCVYRHRAAREGMNFTTVECPRNITQVLKMTECGGIFLLDSVTALLANEMFSTDGEVDLTAFERVKRDLGNFVNAVNDAVIVSDYIYSDGGQYGDYTQEFVKALALTDRYLAEICDCVVEICMGMAMLRKGALPKRKEGMQSAPDYRRRISGKA